MPKVTIDGVEIEVPPGTTVLQACERPATRSRISAITSGSTSPATAGCAWSRCEKSPKPVASCAMPAADGKVIHTDTPMVKKARKGVMELLLINHPLDCPICDQGGECDLQDQAMAYGRDHSRYDENKRRGRRQIFRAARQDAHDALHPLHALHPLPRRGRRGRGAGRDRPRRGHGDHDLYRGGARPPSCRPTSSTCARSAR